jgi:hypothetical protein
MTMGHYATALIPYAREKGWPLWLLLLCAQFGDVLWLLLAAVGIEPTQPSDFRDVSILAMRVDMRWSHGLLPVLVTAALVASAVFAVKRQGRLSLWCGALVVGHVLCDYLCGWRHEVFGPQSAHLGLGLYETPSGIYTAFAIEAVFSAACVLAFVQLRKGQGQALSARAQALLYAAFIGGTLLFLPNGTRSLNDWLGKL